MTSTVLCTTAARRDVKTIRKRNPHLLPRLNAIDAQLQRSPRVIMPCLGDLSGPYSRRLDCFHRLVYRIEQPDVVVGCLGRYGDS